MTKQHNGDTELYGVYTSHLYKIGKGQNPSFWSFALQKAYVLNQEETTKCNDFVRQLIDLAKAKRRRKKKSEPLFKHSKAELERDVTMLNLSRSCKETTLR
jgi:hypothetical protein